MVHEAECRGKILTLKKFIFLPRKHCFRKNSGDDFYFLIRNLIKIKISYLRGCNKASQNNVDGIARKVSR